MKQPIVSVCMMVWVFATILWSMMFILGDFFCTLCNIYVPCNDIHCRFRMQTSEGEYDQLLREWCSPQGSMSIPCLPNCFWIIDDSGFSVANSLHGQLQFVTGWKGPYKAWELGARKRSSPYGGYSWYIFTSSGADCGRNLACCHGWRVDHLVCFTVHSLGSFFDVHQDSVLVGPIEGYVLVSWVGGFSPCPINKVPPGLAYGFLSKNIVVRTWLETLPEQLVLSA